MRKPAERIAVADARRTIAKLLNQVQHDGERYIITRHDIAIAVLLPVDALRKLEGIEAREGNTL